MSTSCSVFRLLVMLHVFAVAFKRPENTENIFRFFCATAMHFTVCVCTCSDIIVCVCMIVWNDCQLAMCLFQVSTNYHTWNW